jgi:nucleotide-binding universal stress UspA family protein
MITETFNSKIQQLFVVRVFDQFVGLYVPPSSIGTPHKEIMEGAEKRLVEFVDQCFKDCPDLAMSVVAGDATDMIINYVTSNAIDLVIMGTHGRKGLDKVIFVLVAERVVKTASGSGNGGRPLQN